MNLSPPFYAEGRHGADPADCAQEESTAATIEFSSKTKRRLGSSKKRMRKSKRGGAVDAESSTNNNIGYSTTITLRLNLNSLADANVDGEHYTAATAAAKSSTDDESEEEEWDDELDTTEYGAAEGGKKNYPGLNITNNKVADFAIQIFLVVLCCGVAASAYFCFFAGTAEERRPRARLSKKDAQPPTKAEAGDLGGDDEDDTNTAAAVTPSSTLATESAAQKRKKEIDDYDYSSLLNIAGSLVSRDLTDAQTTALKEKLKKIIGENREKIEFSAGDLDKIKAAIKEVILTEEDDDEAMLSDALKTFLNDPTKKISLEDAKRKLGKPNLSDSDSDTNKLRKKMKKARGDSISSTMSSTKTIATDGPGKIDVFLPERRTTLAFLFWDLFEEVYQRAALTPDIFRAQQERAQPEPSEGEVLLLSAEEVTEKLSAMVEAEKEEANRRSGGKSRDRLDEKQKSAIGDFAKLSIEDKKQFKIRGNLEPPPKSGTSLSGNEVAQRLERQEWKTYITDEAARGFFARPEKAYFAAINKLKESGTSTDNFQWVSRLFYNGDPNLKLLMHPLFGPEQCIPRYVRFDEFKGVQDFFLQMDKPPRDVTLLMGRLFRGANFESTGLDKELQTNSQPEAVLKVIAKVIQLQDSDMQSQEGGKFCYLPLKFKKNLREVAYFNYEMINMLLVPSLNDLLCKVSKEPKNPDYKFRNVLDPGLPFFGPSSSNSKNLGFSPPATTKENPHRFVMYDIEPHIGGSEIFFREYHDPPGPGQGAELLHSSPTGMSQAFQTQETRAFYHEESSDYEYELVNLMRESQPKGASEEEESSFWFYVPFNPDEKLTLLKDYPASAGPPFPWILPNRQKVTNHPWGAVRNEQHRGLNLLPDVFTFEMVDSTQRYVVEEDASRRHVDADLLLSNPGGGRAGLV